MRDRSEFATVARTVLIVEGITALAIVAIVLIMLRHGS